MIATHDSLPALSRSAEEPALVTADVLVVAVALQEEQTVICSPGLNDETSSALQESARAIGYSGKTGEVARIPAPTGVTASSVVLIGLGTRQESSAEERRRALRFAAGQSVRALERADTVALAFPLDDAEDAEAVTTGALLGAYRYTPYLTTPNARGPQRLVLLADENAQEGAESAAILARAVAHTRDLVNQPPSDLFPAAFAEAVSQQAAAFDGRVGIEVIDDATLRERGFGGLIGVGEGSARGPRLVALRYEPANAVRHLSFVGKGITFDSGGISIKPALNMEKMKSDMAGAAAAAQALFAIAELGLPVRVTAWLALAENLPSGTALRPSDVLRIYGGKTVEVVNTDAEGRLVLADALVAAQEESPDLLIDLATLTGAQVAALGRRTSGIMGTPPARREVRLAADAAGEPMWEMPIPDEVLRPFDSDTADLKNVGAPAAGMLGAAAFLREFVDEGTAWAHLDIAGPAYNGETGYGFTVTGGTGVGVRTLVELAERTVRAATNTHRATGE